MAPLILRLALRAKSFATPQGRRQVLGPIALSLGAQEIVALVGPSGCGKSTLLRIAGGLERDFDGVLHWPGGVMPRIGTVFQEPLLLPWRNVRQNLLLAQPTPDPSRADALLQELDLAPFAAAYPPSLSLGMARRAAIARAFCIAPSLLLLDEPFVSLDRAMAARSRALLVAAWRQRPTAALLVTHDRAEAAALADRILLLGDQPTRVLRELVVPQHRRRPDDAAAAWQWTESDVPGRAG